MNADDDVVRAVHDGKGNLERVREGDIEVNDFNFGNFHFVHEGHEETRIF
jgi:hypothetical protein